MNFNDKGLTLIKSFEGLRLHAYPDPGTGGDPITIGYGHTGPGIHLGMVITDQQAEDFLKADLAKFCPGVAKLITNSINDNQFSALVCFAYNVGLHNLSTSTLLKCVNAGNHAQAATEFLKWNKAAGQVLPGLTRRRQAESDLYKEPMAQPV